MLNETARAILDTLQDGAARSSGELVSMLGRPVGPWHPGHVRNMLTGLVGFNLISAETLRSQGRPKIYRIKPLGLRYLDWLDSEPSLTEE